MEELKQKVIQMDDRLGTLEKFITATFVAAPSNLSDQKAEKEAEIRAALNRLLKSS
jgi:hypothetical protein